MTFKPLDWETLVELEPALGALLAEVQAIHDDGKAGHFCRHDYYMSMRWDQPGLKRRFSELVGWHARNKNALLHTSEAYDLVLEIILEALPPCRNCCCGACG
jgi:hypothetical protein